MNHTDKRTCKCPLKDEKCTRTVSLIKKIRRKKHSSKNVMVDEFDSRNASTEVGLLNLRVAGFPEFMHSWIIFFLVGRNFVVVGRKFFWWVEYVFLAGFQLTFQSCLVENFNNANSFVLVSPEGLPWSGVRNSRFWNFTSCRLLEIHFPLWIKGFSLGLKQT